LLGGPKQRLGGLWGENGTFGLTLPTLPGGGGNPKQRALIFFGFFWSPPTGGRIPPLGELFFFLGGQVQSLTNAGYVFFMGRVPKSGGGKGPFLAGRGGGVPFGWFVALHYGLAFCLFFPSQPLEQYFSLPLSKRVRLDFGGAVRPPSLPISWA